MKYLKNYYSSHYKNENLNFNLINYKKAILKDIFGFIKKNDRILDLGCGVGYLLKVLEDEKFRNLYGVEMDLNQYLESKKILQYSNLYNVDAIKFLSKTKTKFNVIILYDFIEHLNRNNIVKLLNLCNSRLIDGGILIIKTPNANFLLSGRMRYIDFTHEISFTESSIKSVLFDARFKEIESFPTNKNINMKSKFILLPIRLFGDFTLRLYLSCYMDYKKAFRLILTPNFITVAKK